MTLNRPEARNALTWEMYDALVQACDTAEADRNLRVLIIRGSGGAFAAGTDISQFRDFDSGDDGVAYERRLDAVIDRIERVSLATIAEIDGAAAGGGCAIAMACDLRICSERARFGVPVSRTLGNCLSMANTARMVDLIGPALTRDLLLTGRMIDARDAMAVGLASLIVPSTELQQETFKIAAELSNAPAARSRRRKRCSRGCAIIAGRRRDRPTTSSASVTHRRNSRKASRRFSPAANRTGTGPSPLAC